MAARHRLVRAALVAAFAGLVTGVAGAFLPPAALAAPALPDSVVVRLPGKDLTLEDVQKAWFRLESRFRPAGRGVALRRAFVDQLIDKEVLARAALAEPFTFTRAESARYNTQAADLGRQALYRILILDSLEVTAEDRANAVAALEGDPATPKGNPPDSAQVELAAQRMAQTRRAKLVSERIRDALAPVWDDSVAAVVARGFAALPPTRQQVGDGMQVRISNRVPDFAPADSGRVLVASTEGPITIGGFVQRFLALNPLERTYPTSPGEVKARGEQFLGSTWMLNEARRRGLEHDPQVAEALARRREEFALDHFYDRHVASAVDTSTALLTAEYAADPKRWAVNAHDVLFRMSVPDSATADSVRAAVAAGTRWEDLCARRYADNPAERDRCGRAYQLFPGTADSLFARQVAALPAGATLIGSETTRSGERPVVWYIHEHVAYRVRPFDEARTYVGHELAARQTETRLQELLAGLRAKTPFTVNQAALARLDFGPDSAD